MANLTRVTDDVDDNLAAYHNELIDGIQAIEGPMGWGQNYRFTVTVSSNDLVVTLLNFAGNTPSSTDMIKARIGNTMRSITAASTFTIVDGTNWFNSGGAELGTLPVGYFLYLVYDSNSSIVAPTISRIPYARVVSDFSATTTNEKHCYNYANFTTTDDVINIGYFEATLSLAGTSHLWTVPTFTNINLRAQPTLETPRWLDWTPAYSASGSLTFTSVSTTWAKYKIKGAELVWTLRASGTLGGTASTQIFNTVPFEAIQSANSPLAGSGNTATVAAKVFITAGTPDTITWSKYDTSNYATSGSNVLNGEGFWEI